MARHHIYLKYQIYVVKFSVKNRKKFMSTKD